MNDRGKERKGERKGGEGGRYRVEGEMLLRNGEETNRGSVEEISMKERKIKRAKDRRVESRRGKIGGRKGKEKRDREEDEKFP